MLHNWYFKDNNPIFRFKDLVFSVQVFTETNRYDLDPSHCEILKNDANEFEVYCNKLQWAGGQENALGFVNVKVTFIDNKYQVNIYAKKDEIIKRVKLKLMEEKLGTVIAKRRYMDEISVEGEIYRYPNGWDSLFTPLLCIKNDKDVRYYRSLDTTVRPKSFTLYKVNETATVELVYEEDARFKLNEINVPPFEIGNVSNYENIYEIQRLYVEKAYNLKKWNDRNDAPSWAKDISLIISLHGMHWSGYIFNTYRDMEEKLIWFSKHIDPKEVLVYIPGFDGRYYYKYADYAPDARMGGEEGLKHLIDMAHNLGYHVMPMFMVNGANPKNEGFEIWGTPSIYHSSNGYVKGVGSCDWDTSRAYDLACGIGLNPGAPLWQDHFVNEAIKQIGKYNFDAIFLDLAAIYENDPRYSTHEGVINIIKRLHEKFPHLLISTEGWYDALSTVFPLSQCAGQANRGGEMVYHDTPYAKFFDEYNRCFGHLCLGDVANGRNGVFEWGINLAERTMPVRKGIIPTLTIVDDTIKIAPNEVLKVIEDAKKYKKQFIERKDN